MHSSHATLVATCAFASVVNVLILNAWLSRPQTPRFQPRNWNYSYEGTDFPMYLISPDDMPKVALDIEESVHHAIGQEAMFDWEHYVDAHGWFKAGPNHHGFVPTMYHDLHCMRMLHRALFPALAVEETAGDHAQHCLNYIRQTVLCYPDLTLEPPDVMSRNWTVDRAGGSTHVCYDWSLALRRGDELHSDWLEFVGQLWEMNSR